MCQNHGADTLRGKEVSHNPMTVRLRNAKHMLWAALPLLAFGLGLACNGGTEDIAVELSTPLPDEPSSSATLEVNTTSDDDVRDGELSLREAILLATGVLHVEDVTEEEKGQVEGTPGESSADTIQFESLPLGADGTGVITLSDSLPVLSSGFDGIEGDGAVVIDGASGTFPCVHLDSAGNRLLGVILQNCRTAILVDRDARANQIGGPEEGQSNVISGNVVGMEVRGEGNLIQGNIIGLDAAGAAPLPNEFEGIWMAPGSKNNLIGGTEPGEGNVISGNDLFGISVDGDGTTGNRILGNLVGTDPAGTVAMGNKYGIIVQSGARENFVGGEEDGASNVISGNNTGILIRGPETSQNVVSGNYFGLQSDGQTELDNVVDLWVIEDAGENVVEGNISAEPLGQ